MRFTHLRQFIVLDYPEPVGQRALRQGPDRNAGGDRRTHTRDALAGANDLVFQAGFLKEIEAASPPPAAFVEQSHRQRSAGLDIVERGASPDRSFAMNDNIVFPGLKWRVQSDIEFAGGQGVRKIHTRTAAHENTAHR